MQLVREANLVQNYGVSQVCLYHTPGTSPLSTVSECPCFSTRQHASISTSVWSGLTAIRQWVLEPCSKNLPSRATATLFSLDFPREKSEIKLLGSSSSFTFPTSGEVARWYQEWTKGLQHANTPLVSCNLDTFSSGLKKKGCTKLPTLGSNLWSFCLYYCPRL